MTPQERAAELAEQISGAYHQLDYPGVTVRSLVLEALTATRRAALLEAAKVAHETNEEEPFQTYVILEALDRLASEGG